MSIPPMPRSSFPAQPVGGVPCLSVDGLSALMHEATQGLVRQFDGAGLYVRAVGRLGEMPAPGRTAMLYRVPLHDLQGDGVVHLDLPERLRTQLRLETGMRVEVIGTISAQVYRGNVSIRLNVSDATHMDPSAVGENTPSDRHIDLVSTLRSTTVERRPFPTSLPLRLTLIGPKSQDAQVDEDFRRAVLAEAPAGAVVLQHIRVSMHDGAAVAQAVRAAQGDVLALIRGGGPREDFAVFDRPEVIQALDQSSGFRLVGLGHAGNTTLADFVADHSATTPTAAGAYLGNKIREMQEEQVRNPASPVYIRGPQSWWVRGAWMAVGAAISGALAYAYACM